MPQKATEDSTAAPRIDRNITFYGNLELSIPGTQLADVSAHNFPSCVHYVVRRALLD